MSEEFKDLGFAKVDVSREKRTGFPEVIFCEGKTMDEIRSIFDVLKERHERVLLTRATKEAYTAIKNKESGIRYNERARVIIYEKTHLEKKGNVLVICAGTSDIPVAEEAVETLQLMGNNVTKVYDVGVAGIHRLLAQKNKFSTASCIVVAAGMDGAIVPTIAGLVSCPVIAVPTSTGYGASFNGLAALLSMLNSCAAGVSVVNIDNGFGAGYVASLINRGKEVRT